jgi:hypothetical protein
MSDIFGATDLDADMPGLGPQTGNVRGPPVSLPSQLHALAQRVGQPPQQGQSGSKPPSPPQGQGGKPPKPRLGSTDPPDPTAYSYAPVPANVPRTPPGFTPYTMPIPRDSSQWNKPEPYPRQPQSFELPGLFQKMGGYFAQHGGAAGAPLGATSAAYAAAYQEAYMKGQEWKMRQAKEQLTLSNAKLADVERARQIDYADKFSAYQVMGGGDPTELHDELWKVAVEHGDKDVQALLERGASAEEVRRFLADHEAHIRALEAANSKSAEQDSEDAKRWGLPGGETSPTDPMDIPVGQQAAQPPRDQVAGPGARPPPEPGTSPAPQQSTPLKPYEQVGLDIARGRPSTGLPKKVADAAQEYAAGVDTRMDDVVAHSAGKTREQIAQELSAISPAIAADWSKLLDGKQGLPGGMGAIGARPYWSNLSDLSLAVKPSWSAADFQRIPELNKEYDAGPTGRRMGRTESMAAAGRTLLEALHQIPEGETPPEGALEAWFNHTISGDSKWGRVFSAYHTYVQEAQTIASQTGNFHETDVKRVMRETPYTAGPKFLLGGTMLVDAQNAVDTMSAFNADYKSVVGRDALHYNPKAIATLQTIASYDPKTNQFTDLADPTLKGLDRSFDAQPSDPAAPGGLPPGWSVSPVQ